jgi:hypothetical protein
MHRSIRNASLGVLLSLLVSNAGALCPPPCRHPHMLRCSHSSLHYAADLLPLLVLRLIVPAQGTTDLIQYLVSGRSLCPPPVKAGATTPLPKSVPRASGSSVPSRKSSDKRSNDFMLTVCVRGAVEEARGGAHSFGLIRQEWVLRDAMPSCLTRRPRRRVELRSHKSCIVPLEEQ